VSTEDDRPRHAGGDYASGGSFNRGGEAYSGATSSYFDDTDYGSQTTVLPGSSPYDSFTDETTTVIDRPRKAATWHAGADLGLLVLRVTLGALFIAHALQQLFGWFQGDGLTGTANLLAHFGYHNTAILAWVTGLSQLVGGTFVLLGLFTPIGAAAILGVMANAIIVKFHGSDFAGGVELESIYAAAAFAILFAGPGRVSLDRPTPWYRYNYAFGVVFFVIAIGATVTFLLVFR
jgi:putative oxidoreductase